MPGDTVSLLPDHPILVILGREGSNAAGVLVKGLHSWGSFPKDEQGRNIGLLKVLSQLRDSVLFLLWFPCRLTRRVEHESTDERTDPSGKTERNQKPKTHTRHEQSMTPSAYPVIVVALIRFFLWPCLTSCGYGPPTS